MDFKKNDELKYIIGRYDHYYDSVNNKGNFYLTINTFALGGLLTWFLSLSSNELNITIILLIAFTLICNLASIFLTLMAIKPHLNSVKDNDEGSVIFFSDVANYHLNQFESKWENMNEQLMYSDLKKQSFLLADGLNKKFQLLKYTTWIIGVEILLIVILGLIFIII